MFEGPVGVCWLRGFVCFVVVIDAGTRRLRVRAIDELGTEVDILREYI